MVVLQSGDWEEKRQLFPLCFVGLFTYSALVLWQEKSFAAGETLGKKKTKKL